MPKKVTLAAIEALLKSIPQPTLHPRKNPIVLTKAEDQEYRETGQVLIHYDDGTAAYVFSQENMKRLKERLGIEDA